MTEVPNYVVIVREFGTYTAATMRLFTAKGAARYASGMAKGWEPHVVTIAEYLQLVEGWRIDEGQTPPARLTNRFRLG